MSNWFDEDRQTIRYIGVHQRSTMATFDKVAIELVDLDTMVGLAHVRRGDSTVCSDSF